MTDLRLDDAILTTRVDAVINWARKNSLWPLPFGTACCAIEFMGMMASRFDFSRFGAEALRFSPRQSDLLLVLGTVTNKQAPVLRQIYAQMAEPKWVVSVGVCASSGGMYAGMAPAAEVLALKVLDRTGSGYTSSVIQAIDKKILADRFDELVAGVKRGDILFFEAWRQAAENETIRQVYEMAGR